MPQPSATRVALAYLQRQAGAHLDPEEKALLDEGKALLVKADGKVKGILPKNGKKFSLPEAQKLVGGYVEMNSVGQYRVLMNEDGLMVGLPPNRKASRIFGQPLVGDILFIHRGMF